jgi:hypothetical protein
MLTNYLEQINISNYWKNMRALPLGMVLKLSSARMQVPRIKINKYKNE